MSGDNIFREYSVSYLGRRRRVDQISGYSGEVLPTRLDLLGGDQGGIRFQGWPNSAPRIDPVRQCRRGRPR